MNDTIYRRDAIDAVKRYIDLVRDDEDPDVCAVLIGVNRMIASMPTAQPRWIPVTERLPDKGGPYLCTVQGYVGKTTYLRIAVFQTDIYVEYDIEEHKPGFIDYDSECGFYEVTKVLAWMPLPEPWEGNCNDD